MGKSQKIEGAASLSETISKKSNALHENLSSELSKEDRLELEVLKDRIGRGLIQLDPSHADIDRETLTEFLNWHEEFDEPPPCNAILTGAPGTGKSRALAYSAFKMFGMGVDWITAYEFAELVSDLGTDRSAHSKDRLRDLADVVILYFDDLGSANFTPQRLAQFFKLMDIRYRRGWPTFFSTNYSTPELKKLILHSGALDCESNRILWRIVGTYSEPRARFFHFKKSGNQ